PRRLSAKLQYRSYGEFPLLVQSEERRDRHFPHPSGDGQPHFYRPIHPSGHARDHRLPHLELVGGEEAQTSVKFIKPPSPHPGSFLKAPMPLPMGEGGRRPGEGSVVDRTALLGVLRLLATPRRSAASCRRKPKQCSRKDAEAQR